MGKKTEKMGGEREMRKMKSERVVYKKKKFFTFLFFFVFCFSLFFSPLNVPSPSTIPIHTAKAGFRILLFSELF